MGVPIWEYAGRITIASLLLFSVSYSLSVLTERKIQEQKGVPERYQETLLDYFEILYCPEQEIVVLAEMFDRLGWNVKMHITISNPRSFEYTPIEFSGQDSEKAKMTYQKLRDAGKLRHQVRQRFRGIVLSTPNQ